jgi:hypothetical protein
MTETKIFLFDMKPELQRIKIAEAFGWKWERLWTGELHGKPVGEQGPFREVPDYLNDLNAMHEAEKSLQLKDQMLYQGMIGRVTGNRCPALFGQIHATAAQRAEAFLRTLNLWEE